MHLAFCAMLDLLLLMDKTSTQQDVIDPASYQLNEIIYELLRGWLLVFNVET